MAFLTVIASLSSLLGLPDGIMDIIQLVTDAPATSLGVLFVSDLSPVAVSFIQGSRGKGGSPEACPGLLAVAFLPCPPQSPRLVRTHVTQPCWHGLPPQPHFRGPSPQMVSLQGPGDRAPACGLAGTRSPAQSVTTWRVLA